MKAQFKTEGEWARVVLRDGATATLRVATPQDREAMERFLDRLSPQSRRRRFFSAGMPAADLIPSLCDDADPSHSLTLVVLREVSKELRIVATGSYLRVDARTAEVAFEVDDRLQGLGLGTVLLERLAILAVDPEIGPEHVRRTAAFIKTVPEGALPSSSARVRPEGSEPTLEEIERTRIHRALQRTGGVQARAARLLNMTPRKLAYRIRKYGLEAE